MVSCLVTIWNIHKTMYNPEVDRHVYLSRDRYGNPIVTIMYWHMLWSRQAEDPFHGTNSVCLLLSHINYYDAQEWFSSLNPRGHCLLPEPEFLFPCWVSLTKYGPVVSWGGRRHSLVFLIPAFSSKLWLHSVIMCVAWSDLSFAMPSFGQTLSTHCKAWRDPY